MKGGRIVGKPDTIRNGFRGNCSRAFRLHLTGFQRHWFESTQSYSLSAGLRRAGSSRISRRAVAQ